MPNISLLTMDHADIEGGDYCFTTPQFVDPISDCRIYSFYSLIHIKKPALSQCSFAFHPNECLWSSLCSKSNLDSPKEVFARFIDNESFDFDVSQLPLITRAVHFQPLMPNLSISSRRALLFRQMEGGKILYENVFFDPLPKLKQDEEFDILCEENGNYDGSFTQKPISISSINKNCFEFISNIQDENKFFNDVDEQLIASNEIEFSAHIDKIWTKTFTTSKNQKNQPIFDKNEEDTKIINLNGSMDNEVENFTATKLEELKLEAAYEKSGPSGGAAIATSMISRIIGLAPISDTAIVGEIDQLGTLLEVG
uniref:Lon proteolytic domain-containing protein n=1 Tax=Meloidogyne javanica TaxID=6303 RepID=A0A915LPW9_MELJA